MTAFPFTVFRIHLVKGERRDVESEFTDLDSAVEHVKWLMRHEPGRRVTLDVIPPTGSVPPPPAPGPASDFEQRLSNAVAELAGSSPVPSPRSFGYRYGDQPRSQTEMELYASWEAQRGDTGEPNPFETLVQKSTQQHHDVVEKACEEALQGGEYGVRVDVYPTRTVAYVDPTVPYGRSVEHQHLIDPGSAL